MTNKKIYILLTDTGSLLTRLIKLYTNKPYNHVSISFDAELREVYSFGRKNVNNPFAGGFVCENTKAGLFKNATCAIYSLTVSEEQLVNMRYYIKEMEAAKEKYHYNFLGLFGFIFNKPVKRERHFFCSQFVATVLDKGNVLHFHKPLALIAPNDLQEYAELELVYEGKLWEYHNDDAPILPALSFQQNNNEGVIA